MPSPSNPVQTVSAGNGPQQGGSSSGGGAIAAAFLAHITNASGAHAASAISYAGDGTWADGTTNPAGNVETQLDKIIGDLGTGDGAGKIRYDGGPDWADTTTNPGTTVGAQLDKIVSDLASTAGFSGTGKIGSAAIVNPSITVPAGTLASQLVVISNATGVDYQQSGIWADSSVALSDGSVQQAIEDIVSTLSATAGPNGGTRKIGGEQIVNTSATITAGTLLSQLTLLSRAANLQYNPGPAWLGGRTNGSNTVQGQLDKIINDLGATAAGDDGAERIGTQTVGDLAGGSVRAQLNELDTGWGKLARANTWTNVQTFNGAAGDTNAAMRSDVLPTNRKLLWRVLITDTPVNIYVRFYSDKDFISFLITYNAEWNGTNWVADDTSPAGVAHEFRFDGTLFGNFRVSTRFDTSVAWATNGWDEYGTIGGRNLTLGNTTVSGPAPLATFLTMENPEILFLNTADSTGGDSNPPATQGHINRLKAKNVPKMWANITTGGVTDLIQDGFNIASINSSGSTCVVNFASAMDVDDFACVAMCMSDQQTLIYSSARTTSSVTLKAYNTSTNTQVTLGSTPIVISVIVFGKQDS